MLIWYKLSLLLIAGAFGTLCRFSLASLVYRVTGLEFPWGTVAVNLLGCLLAGLLWSLFDRHGDWPVEARLAVMVGFLGAFTTFSTFMLETGQLIQEGAYLAAAGNLALQNTLGLAAVFAGLMLGRVA